MSTFARWTETSIIASLAEVYGSGWKNDALKLAAVTVAIGSAWITVCLRLTPKSGVTPASCPSAFNQLWYLESMWQAGMHIAPEGQAVALYAKFAEALLRDIRTQPATGEGSYTYST